MTTINVGEYSFSDNINGIKTVTFYHTGEKVYSAATLDNIYGVFISNAIAAPDGFLRWNDMVVNTTSMNNVWIYVRSSDTDIENANWYGPYKNETTDISSFDGIMIQFMVVIKGNNITSPVISSIVVDYLSSQTSAYFFTRTFNIGFRPKHILLTYNATESEDSIVRFAITGENTTDLTKYQFIDANKIEELDEISIFSDKIKLMMEISGDSGVPIVVHEIAATFSGENVSRVNKIAILSTSSESTSSSSSSSVDSSSSISSSSSSSSP